MKRIATKLVTCFVILISSFIVLSGVVGAQENTPSTDSISVQTIKKESVSRKILEQAEHSWPWYIARASGFVAAFSLIFLMLSGIGQMTGLTYKFFEPLMAWASHRALGIVFMLSIVLHMFIFLFDKFIAFNLWDILLPWFSDFKPLSLFGFSLGSFYLALGILAFYLSLAIVVTSLLIVNKKPVLWKLIHLMSYIVMLFVFIHALQMGTDLSHGIMRAIWIIIGNIVSIAIIFRARRAFTT